MANVNISITDRLDPIMTMRCIIPISEVWKILLVLGCKWHIKFPCSYLDLDTNKFDDWKQTDITSKLWHAGPTLYQLVLVQVVSFAGRKWHIKFPRPHLGFGYKQSWPLKTNKYHLKIVTCGAHSYQHSFHLELKGLFVKFLIGICDVRIFKDNNVMAFP